jgi:hypothetical protein
MATRAPPTAFHSESPLDSLVRRASSRRARPAQPPPQILVASEDASDDDEDAYGGQYVGPDDGAGAYSHQYIVPDDDDDGAHGQYIAPDSRAHAHGYAYDEPPAPARPRPPSSPLLHTRFRTSTATTLTAFDSTLDHSRAWPTADDASVYSQDTSHDVFDAPPPPAAPFARNAGRDTVDDFSSYYRDSRAPGPPPPVFAPPPVPAVVVEPPRGPGLRQGPGHPSSSSSSLARPAPPSRVPSGGSDKAAVIARNLHRAPSAKSLRQPLPLSPSEPVPTRLTVHPGGSATSLSPSPSHPGSRAPSPTSRAPSPSLRAPLPSSRAPSPSSRRRRRPLARSRRSRSPRPRRRRPRRRAPPRARPPRPSPRCRARSRACRRARTSRGRSRSPGGRRRPCARARP